MLRSLVSILFISFLCAQASAHEFWIEPEQYQVESGGSLDANLIIGQKFEGASRIYLDRKIKRFELISGDEVTTYQGRLGDDPALQSFAPKNGILVIAHETRPERLRYKSWQDFLDFAEHKDFDDIELRHRNRGLPESGFVEHYSRHAKALVAIGNSSGKDREIGMTTEFVALTNPYSVPRPDHVSVRLLLEGVPRVDAQVEVFEKDAQGIVGITVFRTDSEGDANIPVRQGHTYLIDAVALRPVTDHEEVVWESLWAAMTFMVP